MRCSPHRHSSRRPQTYIHPLPPTMAVLHRHLPLALFLFSTLASSFISSDAALQLHGSIGRTLLQAKTSCPVNFEFMNYTVITSQCKGPQYLPKLCCEAFKEFACPYAENLNDPTNDCASTMFSYINLYGKYPPGLFSSECVEGREGLSCPGNSSHVSADSNGAYTPLNLSTPLLFGIILILMVQFF